MEHSLIGAMRRRVLMLRIICAGIILTFGGLVTSPAAAAVRQEYQAIQAATASANGVESRLARVLIKTRQALEKASSQIARQTGKPDWVAIKNLHRTIQKLDNQVSNRFDRIEAHIKSMHLPSVILRRQADAVAKYRAHMDDLLTALSVAESADNTGDVRAALQKAFAVLEEVKLAPSSQPFDPKHLPFGSAKDKAREPNTSHEMLKAAIASTTQDQPTTLVATAVYTQDDAKNSVYLSETPDVQLTDAILTKAADLDHDPVSIYNWVHNNVEYIPSYGSIQGADQTLKTLRGNDFDTASLLIALLRASDIPARYVYGTVRIPIDRVMNWVGGVMAPQAALQLLGQGGIPNIGLTSGGVIKSVRIEHVWVEAWIDYSPSRGARNREGDAWIPLDASFKQYTYKTGMDIRTQVSFDEKAFSQHLIDTATINKDEGWVQGVDQAYIQSQFEAYQQQINDFVNEQNPDASVGDVLGAKVIVEQTAPVLASGLPYNVIAVGDRMASLPASLRWKFRYALIDQYGTELMSYTASTPALAGKAFALSFRPATDADAKTIASYLSEVPEDGALDPSDLPDSLPGYLIHVMPEISLNGQPIAVGGSYELGAELRTKAGYWSPNDGWQFRGNVLTAGTYQAIGLDLQGIAPVRLGALKAKVAATKGQLSIGSAYDLTGHDLGGVILQAGILSYFAANDAQSRIASTAADVVLYPQPSYGTFNTTARAVYSFGVPRSVGFPGVNMDIDWYKTSVVSKDADVKKKADYYRIAGLRMSAFEHIIPEQLFSKPSLGISAVKALAIAAAQGQRIFTVTKFNVTTVLPQLMISAKIRSDISAATNAGLHVIVSQAPISYRGWHGTGYIILDPDTSAGAYKISGGLNGSSLQLTNIVLSIFGIWSELKATLLLDKLGKDLVSGVLLNYLTLASAVIDAIDINMTCANASSTDRALANIGLISVYWFAIASLALLPFGPFALFVLGLAYVFILPLFIDRWIEPICK